MSWKFGDDTAYNLGRVTLNPIAHTDPIGTLLLPILGFLSASMGGLALLGWGKPCPINPRNWANYKKANFWVSLAGVLGNLILVFVAFALIKVVVSLGYYQAIEFVSRTQDAIVMFVQSLLLMNVSLIVFNLLPFPPLDGSKILSNFLPPSFQPVFDMLDQYGVIFLWILVISGVTGYIFRPVFELVVYLILLVN